MLNVLLTVDTEIWCGGWDDLDARFPAAFEHYVYGPTPSGRYGLPALLATLTEHGLRGVFFVEALFSKRFGIAPLEEIVGLIREAEQEIQLHLHPEWADETVPPLLPELVEKQPRLGALSVADQARLIAIGKQQLVRAGAPTPCAFRAGSYALSVDTLSAVRESGLVFDSSYNPASEVGVADVARGETLLQPRRIEGVWEIPVTAFEDGSARKLRPLQLTACSSAELEHVLSEAAEAGWTSAVVVLHNFELLTPDKRRVDRVAARRFQRLCRFLDRHRDRFSTIGFDTLQPESGGPLGARVIRSARWRTALRQLEQAARRLA